jgi:hypothetical protein
MILVLIQSDKQLAEAARIVSDERSVAADGKYWFGSMSAK